MTSIISKKRNKNKRSSNNSKKINKYVASTSSYNNVADKQQFSQDNNNNNNNNSGPEFREQAQMHQLFNSREDRLTKKFQELEEWQKRLKIAQIDYDSRNESMNEKITLLRQGEKLLVKEKDELIIERQKLDAIRRRLTEHQKEVAAKITELAEEASKRDTTKEENNRQIEEYSKKYLREKEDKDHAFYELKEMEKREKKAMENVKNAELNVKEMEQNMLKIQNKLKTMQEKMNVINMKEQQLIIKEQEHELLVKAYIERKNEVDEKKKSLDIQYATITQRENEAKEITLKAENALKKVNEEKELIKAAQRCNQEMRDVNKVEKEKLSERINKFNIEEKKFNILKQGYDVRINAIKEKEDEIEKNLLESNNMKNTLTTDREEVDRLLKELKIREETCKEKEKKCKKFEIELNLKQMKLDKEKNRLKNLDRNLQQFGEDCETQRELNEEEDIRLKKENKILSERKTCVDALEKRVKEMKVVYEERMNMM